MGSSLNVPLITVILVAALVQISAAQTTHVVGGAMGWIIPSNGAASYSTWAANQTFAVGDTLVFNFTTGTHDVAEVTKADYDACTTSNPILLENTGPASIMLNSSGEHYFICNFTGHCNDGQKLAINVSAVPSTSPSPSPSPLPSSTSPAPHAATTTPATAPSPAPSSSAMTYIVGDNLGWTVPSGNSSAYQTWAANKTFKVGDKLFFNYTAGRHDVAEVTKAAYAPCNGTNPITLNNIPPTTITLTTPGEHFFICTYTQHCPLGQHLAIHVTETAIPAPTTAPAASPSGGAPSSPPTSSSSVKPPSSSTTTSATSPSSGSTSPPPPSSSSARPLCAAGVSATLLSFSVAFFLC